MTADFATGREDRFGETGGAEEIQDGDESQGVGGGVAGELLQLEESSGGEAQTVGGVGFGGGRVGEGEGLGGLELVSE